MFPVADVRSTSLAALMAISRVGLSPFHLFLRVYTKKNKMYCHDADKICDSVTPFEDNANYVSR